MISSSAKKESNNTPNRSPNWLERLVEGSAPSQRDAFTAYVPLQRKVGNKYEDVGTFVLGLYQLAKGGNLRIQKYWADLQAGKNSKKLEELIHEYYPNPNKTLEEKQLALSKLLTHEDGTLKTPFELALVSSNHVKEIEHIVRKEYKWQLAHGLLPQEIYSAQIGDWLGKLEAAGLRIKEGASPKHILWKLANPKPTFRENLVHFVLGWIGTVMTAVAAILMFTSVVNPIMGAILGIGTAMVLKSAHAFSTYDVAEWFLKDGRWAATKNFLTSNRLSVGKTLRTALLLASMGYLAMFGALEVLETALSFPMMHHLPQVLVSGIAYSASVWSFAVAMIGLSIPVRFLDGLSFHNNQIDPKEMNAAQLRALPEDDTHSYKQQIRELNARVRDLEEELSIQESEEIGSEDQRAPMVVQRAAEDVRHHVSEEEEKRKRLDRPFTK